MDVASANAGSWWRRSVSLATWQLALLILAALVAGSLLNGQEQGEQRLSTETQPERSTAAITTATTTTAVTAPPVTEPVATTTTVAPVAELPNVVGLGLQVAQDTLQAAGFYALTSHDSMGFGRLQVLDTNWIVTDQTPAGGQILPTDTPIDLGAKKLGE